MEIHGECGSGEWRSMKSVEVVSGGPCVEVHEECGSGEWRSMESVEVVSGGPWRVWKW